ncbi:hypothetical protein H696_04443 [Fonticula alba]|uniref:Uncharacterized protein n=1 Tax=Fonticula alba TaxID=691883 RepID=A0A058Z539_FONAL|nr:hypothetical protein H696_04443 [Fonticula alba]KCV69023.1 hypothetical protein H696_04443 [Fonticula alba]|eukprot:XP_009496594.1 hypothetical protein H696_04443 [Fonticula alba]
MAQGTKALRSVNRAAKSRAQIAKIRSTKPGIRVIAPKKANVVAATKVQKKLSAAIHRQIETSLAARVSAGSVKPLRVVKTSDSAALAREQARPATALQRLRGGAKIGGRK